MLKSDSTYPPQFDTSFCIYLLGDLQISRGDEQIFPPPYRTHGLLAALLLYPQSTRRDRLAALLFPDLPERTGRRRLSDLLWLLRQALPDLPLETSAQAVCLPPACRWLDVEAFRQAAGGDSLADWLQALALYRGDLLEGLYADWLLQEREYLYLQHVRLLQRACDQLIKEQRFGEARPLAEQLAQKETFDERALCTLMLVYRALGQRGAALAAYERFVARMADELDVEPDPATQALAQDIRNSAPRVSTAVSPATPDISPDAPPEALLQHARQALARGDRAVVQELVERIDFPASLELKVDLALSFEEYDRAAQLLETSGANTPFGQARPEQSRRAHGKAPLLALAARLAQARYQKDAALDAASQALILAGEAHDRRSELEALLVLAQTHCDLGRGVQGTRSAEQALAIARARGSPAGLARALMVSGQVRASLGDRSQALAMFYETRSLAREHGLRPVLAEVLYRISVVQSDQGTQAQAIESAREALSLWRDLGLQRSEIVTSQALALYHALLGDSAECLRVLERVGEISKALGDPVRVAIHHYHLADTLTYHQESLAPRAIALSEQALAVLQAQDLPGWTASTLATLSCALWLVGRHDEALEACRRAIALHRELEEIDFLPALWALEGLIHLNLGAPDQALDCTRRGLQIVMQGSAFNDAIPEVYYAHGMALAACGEDEQAHDYFSRAYRNLVNAAAQHQDEPARQALFNRSPFTRRLMEQVYARGIAPAPDSNTLLRRLPAAHGSTPIQVRWTVDAGPADAALKRAQGAIALRRARLLRLQREAQAQGARPTVAQLAGALDVSTRTVKRDLAALRLSNAK